MKIHKSFFSDDRFIEVAKNWTACGHHIKIRHGHNRRGNMKLSEDWSEVTCKSCLKQKKIDMLYKTKHG